MMEEYNVVITRRDGGGQTRDDYQAIVTRKSDGKQLSFIADWKWWLKLRICRWLLDREFRWYDKHNKKLERKEEFTR
jgi:hypothetical protein